MKLEEQVASLELSKRLKELGVKQESVFFYEFEAMRGPVGRLGMKNLYGNKDYWMIKSRDHFPRYRNEGEEIEGTKLETFSAFTVAELIVNLPEGVEVTKRHAQRIDCWWRNKVGEIATPIFDSENASNALAKMLVYLIEQGIVKP